MGERERERERDFLHHQRRTHHSAGIMKMSSLLPFVLDGVCNEERERCPTGHLIFNHKAEGGAIHCVLCPCELSTAALSSLLWRWRSADLQSYISDFGAGEASASKAIFHTLALADADVQSYLPYFGAGEAPTCKTILPTLVLATHRPAKPSSLHCR